MSGILYYRPSRQTMTDAEVVKLGLAYARGAEGPTFLATSRGPDGGDGVLFTFCPETLPGPGGEIAWSRMPGSDLYVGFYRDRRPTPAEMARPEVHRGYEERLGDGNLWTIPVVRAVGGTSPLPSRMTWNGSTWTTGELEERYRDLFAEACRLWSLIAEAKGGEVTIPEGARVASLALALNYRLGPSEISALGLLDTANTGRVVLDLIDWPVVAELAKKKASGDPSCGPGAGDSSPNTDRRSENS